MTEHYCTQCGREMGAEWFLGPVCGKCCRANHRAVTGAKPARKGKKGARR